MTNFFKRLWQGLSVPETAAPTSDSDVDRIAVLQKSAAKRRADYREKLAQAALTNDSALQTLATASQKLMEEAEAAHLAALQKWENKQYRQKSY
jgi:hypothetical protein